RVMLSPPPRLTLFPYTTLFRSAQQGRLPVGVDAALVRRQQPRDRLQQRRLAGAVRADDADGLAPVGDERQALDRVDLGHRGAVRSEEHTSELQSRENLVCRLLL